MIRLSVNVDHIATLRQARGGIEPDPVAAALFCEQVGCEGITVHIRGDNRHIQERDIRLLKQVVKTGLNLEMAAREETIQFALEVNPHQCTLVPERDEELTTEGGLDIVGQKEELTKVVGRLQEVGMKVSIFVDPEESQIRAAKEVGADRIELHTGIYAAAESDAEVEKETRLLYDAAKLAGELGLGVNAGHDLTIRNLRPMVGLPNLREVSIGHSLMARAVFIGLEKAVTELLEILQGN